MTRPTDEDIVAAQIRVTAVLLALKRRGGRLDKDGAIAHLETAERLLKGEGVEMTVSKGKQDPLVEDEHIFVSKVVVKDAMETIKARFKNDPELVRHITALVDYDWKDEMRHFDETTPPYDDRTDIEVEQAARSIAGRRKA